MSKVQIKILINSIFAHIAGKSTLQIAQEQANDFLRYLPDNSKIDSTLPDLSCQNLQMDGYIIAYDCPFFTRDMVLEPVYRTKYLSDGNPLAVFNHYYNVLEEFKVLSTLPYSTAGATATFSSTPQVSFDELLTSVESSTCNHDWMWYHGFTDTYEYCSKCNKKRD
jgi:hypothetical protein